MLHKILHKIKTVRMIGLKASLKLQIGILLKWNIVYVNKYGIKFKPYSKIGFIAYNYLRELETFNFLKNQLKDVSCFINIGSGYGEYLFLACELGVKKTIGFEPNMISYNHIIENSKVNGFSYPKLEVYSYAIYNSDKKKNFLDDGYISNISEKGKRLVNVRKIDSLNLPMDGRALFLIDAENSMSNVLTGMQNTIEKFKPIIFCECSDENYKFFSEFFESLHYEIMGIFDVSNYLVVPERTFEYV